MSIHHLPLLPDVESEPREPWEGEDEVLAVVAAAGRRAAAWIRSLPAPPGDTWIVGPLADAVEDAMTSLDPADCDDVDRYGSGGVADATAETLRGLIYYMGTASSWLAPEQQIALLAIVHYVSGIPRVLANDPGAAIEGGDLRAVCTLLDFACKDAGQQP